MKSSVLMMGFRGIKSRIFIQFWVLFFLSMLLIDILVLFVSLQKTIARYTDQKHAALVISCENWARFPILENGGASRYEKDASNDDDRIFFVTQAALSAESPYSKITGDKLKSAVYQTIEDGKPVIKKVGKTVGLLLLQHKSVILTHAVKVEGQTIAAGGIESSLTGIYQDYRRIQKIAFAFVVLNSFFFALFANRQLSRIYFKPLKRLSKRAEAYRDEDALFFSVRKEDNEFAILSSSLNKMLHRISENKRMLNETIDSLKTTNLELKKAQNDVIRAEKLATVGRLTSGIAHEIGNPIGIVLGYLDLLKQADLKPEERNDFISRSEKEITRINHIIRQLLDMSRSSDGESKPISIHQLIHDLISLFHFQPKSNDIVFESRLDATADVVFADPDQLRQVFLNILLNAIDAIRNESSDGGRIDVITQGPMDGAEIPVRSERKFIKVTIQDNGSGIPSMHVPHVFDPFFTTKPPGQGTGLGLSVSFMIVEKLGGYLTVSENQAKGAGFHVVLPLSAMHQEIPFK